MSRRAAIAAITAIVAVQALVGCCAPPPDSAPLDLGGAECQALGCTDGTAAEWIEGDS